MSTRTTPSAGPAPTRPRMTIGDLMVIVAVVAFYAWLLRALVSRELTLVPCLSMLLVVMTLGLFRALLNIKRICWYRDDPGYEPIDPCSDQISPQAARDIATTVPRLEALGFRSLGHFHNADSVSNLTQYVSLFENDRSQRTAQRITTVVGVGPTRELRPFLAFLTEFTDGTCLITDNSENSIIYPPLFFRRGSMCFPWVSDPRRLYEIHEASVAYYAGDCIPSGPRIQDPAEYLRADQRRMLARIAEAGLLLHHATRPVYLLTFRGAFRVTWLHTWPIKPIWRGLRRRRARRILRELALDHLLPGNPEPASAAATR